MKIYTTRILKKIHNILNDNLSAKKANVGIQMLISDALEVNQSGEYH